MRKLRRKISAILVILMMAVLVPAVPVQAVTGITANTNIAKAKTIKTRTTYCVTVKNSGTASYLKFTAPSEGTYKFTFSALTFKDKKDALGVVYLGQLGTYGFNQIEVKTEGGKSKPLYLSTRNWWRQYFKGETGVNNYRYTRHASIKLKKGQVLYLRSWTTGTSAYTYTVKAVKKV